MRCDTCGGPIRSAGADFEHVEDLVQAGDPEPHHTATPTSPETEAEIDAYVAAGIRPGP